MLLILALSSSALALQDMLVAFQEEELNSVSTTFLVPNHEERGNLVALLENLSVTEVDRPSYKADILHENQKHTVSISCPRKGNCDCSVVLIPSKSNGLSAPASLKPCVPLKGSTKIDYTTGWRDSNDKCRVKVVFQPTSFHRSSSVSNMPKCEIVHPSDMLNIKNSLKAHLDAEKPNSVSYLVPNVNAIWALDLTTASKDGKDFHQPMSIYCEPSESSSQQCKCRYEFLPDGTFRNSGMFSGKKGQCLLVTSPESIEPHMAHRKSAVSPMAFRDPFGNCHVDFDVRSIQFGRAEEPNPCYNSMVSSQRLASKDAESSPMFKEYQEVITVPTSSSTPILNYHVFQLKGKDKLSIPRPVEFHCSRRCKCVYGSFEESGPGLHLCGSSIKIPNDAGSCLVKWNDNKVIHGTSVLCQVKAFVPLALRSGSVLSRANSVTPSIPILESGTESISSVKPILESVDESDHDTISVKTVHETPEERTDHPVHESINESLDKSTEGVHESIKAVHEAVRESLDKSTESMAGSLDKSEAPHESITESLDKSEAVHEPIDESLDKHEDESTDSLDSLKPIGRGSIEPSRRFNAHGRVHYSVKPPKYLKKL